MKLLVCEIYAEFYFFSLSAMEILMRLLFFMALIFIMLRILRMTLPSFPIIFPMSPLSTLMIRLVISSVSCSSIRTASALSTIDATIN